MLENDKNRNAMKSSILLKTVRLARQVAKHLPYPLFIPFILSSSLVVGVVHAAHTLPPFLETCETERCGILLSEFEVKGGALLEFAFHPNLASMLLHDGFHIA